MQTNARTETGISTQDAPPMLTRELAVYKAHLMDLLDNENKFVVVHGEEIRGPFETYENALQAGYDQFGLEPFLVKQIRRSEPIHYFSRDLPPCRS